MNIKEIVGLITALVLLCGAIVGIISENNIAAAIIGSMLIIDLAITGTYEFRTSLSNKHARRFVIEIVIVFVVVTDITILTWAIFGLNEKTSALIAGTCLVGIFLIPTIAITEALLYKRTHPNNGI